jgi:hypothetical protein
VNWVKLLRSYIDLHASNSKGVLGHLLFTWNKLAKPLTFMTPQMTSPEPSSIALKKGQQPDLKALSRDSRHIFYLWLTVLIIMLSMMILHRHINMLVFIEIATFLFIYLWVLLIARLDQLANSINLTPNNLAFLGILIPVLGTFACYHFIQYRAEQITRSSH